MKKSKLFVLLFLLILYLLFVFIYFSFPRYTHSPKLIPLFFITFSMNVFISFFLRTNIFYFLLVFCNSLFLLFYYGLFMNFEFNDIKFSLKAFFFCLAWYIIYGNWLIPLIIREIDLLFFRDKRDN